MSRFLSIEFEQQSKQETHATQANMEIKEMKSIVWHWPNVKLSIKWNFRTIVWNFQNEQWIEQWTMSTKADVDMIDLGFALTRKKIWNFLTSEHFWDFNLKAHELMLLLKKSKLHFSNKVSRSCLHFKEKSNEITVFFRVKSIWTSTWKTIFVDASACAHLCGRRCCCLWWRNSKSNWRQLIALQQTFF